MGNSHTRNYGVAVGGSLEFSRAIATKYAKLGGTINHNSLFERILVENNHAVGVRLKDGSDRRSDIVISDIYAPTTIFDLLSGQYADESIRQQYSKPIDIQGMAFKSHLGYQEIYRKNLAPKFSFSKSLSKSQIENMTGCPVSYSDMTPALHLQANQFLKSS